jgi:uncharacterized short protein YbdD (DUF466 family)
MNKLKQFFKRAVETCRMMVGVGSYDRYVEHALAHHPEKPVMSYAEYFNYCQSKRYESGAGKCC